MQPLSGEESGEEEEEEDDEVRAIVCLGGLRSLVSWSPW